jgi:hypothetical protein
MKKFDEKFIWSLSAETIRHYTEETLVHKIQENPEHVKMLSEIMEAVFRRANDKSRPERQIEMEISKMGSGWIYQYLKIKGFEVVQLADYRIIVRW